MSQKKTLKIGFVGFGEAASAVARGLRSEGLERLSAFDSAQGVEPHASVIRERADSIGIRLESSLEDLIAVADIIFVATSSASAVEVAEQATRFLSPEKLYVDANAALPEAMVSAAELIARSGSLFVDVAMMGPLPRYLHKVPILACGSGAAQFEKEMAPLGMSIRNVGELPGTASAIKCFRSIYMKGAAALLFETCLAARRYEATDVIVESLSESFNSVPFETWVDRLLNGTAIHAGRRMHEMDDVIETLRHLGVPPTMSVATREVLSVISNMGLSERFGGRTPDDYSTVLAAMEEMMKGTR